MAWTLSVKVNIGKRKYIWSKVTKKQVYPVRFAFSEYRILDLLEKRSSL